MNTVFLLQLFLILYMPKQIYTFWEKNVLKKKKSFIPTYSNFFQAVTWIIHFLFGRNKQDLDWFLLLVL